MNHHREKDGNRGGTSNYISGLKTAYYTIDRGVMDTCLEQLHISEKLLKVVESIYTKV